MRRTSLVSAVAVTALLAAGCGLTDDGVRPGAAAEVEGERLTLSKVDEAVADYCALRAANEQAPAAPTALIRAQFVQGWTQAVAVESLADEYGVPLPPETIDLADVQDAWGELGEVDEDNYDSFELLTWIQQRLSAPVELIGSGAIAEETGEQVAGQPAVTRGVELIAAWLEERDVALNPVLGAYDDETGVFGGDALSVPVSDEAVAAKDTAALTAEQVASLPADQRCGSEALAPGA